jgi:hypothetical protein
MAQVTVNKFIWSFTGQAAHAMAGYIAVSKARQYGGHQWAAIATGIVIAAAIYKEFFWDYHFEDAATRGSSLLDFAMYMVGIAAGWIV